MTRPLIKLYDDLESIEYWSEKLLKDAEEYISKNWAAWTVARKKREQLIRSSEGLKKSTMSLGKSLLELYSMLSIHHQELLAPLVGIYGFKGMMIAEPMATSEIINTSDDPKAGALRLLQPKSDITGNKITEIFRDTTISEFHFDQKKIGENYLIQIDIDKNREQVAEIINLSRPVLIHINNTKAMLREFIQKNVSIEDFFK